MDHPASSQLPPQFFGSVDEEGVTSGADVVARSHVGDKDAATIVAHKDTICEPVSSTDIKRVVPVDPVAPVRRDWEIISIAVTTTSISRANDKRGVRSRTTVQFVVIGTFRLAGLDGHPGAFNMIALGSWVRSHVDGFILGRGARVDRCDFGRVTTFLDEIITLFGDG